MTIIDASLRNDKRKTPELYEFRQLTAGEVAKLATCYYQDMRGQMAHVKITSVKTWKKRPNVEIHCKFGLYEYWQETYSSSAELTPMYEIIE